MAYNALESFNDRLIIPVVITSATNALTTTATISGSEMTVTNGSITVTNITTAVNVVIVKYSAGKGVLSHAGKVICSDTSSNLTATNGKSFLSIQNIGSNIVKIGDSGITQSNYSFKIVPMQICDFGKVASNFSIYFICDAGLTSEIGVAQYD